MVGVFDFSVVLLLVHMGLCIIFIYCGNKVDFVFVILFKSDGFDVWFGILGLTPPCGLLLLVWLGFKS